jgi:sugar/nucleoside kinase (ribokinase family)
MSPRRLFSVGNAVVDLLLELPELPKSGDDITASASGVEVGGSANTLLAARRQGLACVYAGTRGDGPFGAAVERTLEGQGVRVAHEPIVGRDTGWDVAIVEPGGERTFLTTVGAEAALTVDLLADLDVAPRDLVHVSGYSLGREPSGAALAAWLPGLPVATRVLFDPGPLGHAAPAAVLDPVLARTNWWSGNEREALAATGAATAEAAIEMLGRRVGGFGGVVVRLGLRGCLVRQTRGETIEVGGFHVDAIDSNGAGDAHVGVFLAGLASGLTAVAAGRRANAAAAITVTRRGPATAPTAPELDAFLAARVSD